MTYAYLFRLPRQGRRAAKWLSTRQKCLGSQGEFSRQKILSTRRRGCSRPIYNEIEVNKFGSGGGMRRELQKVFTNLYINPKFLLGPL